MNIDASKIEKIINDFEALEQKLADPQATKDIKAYQAFTKEHSTLKDIVLKIKEHRRIDAEIKNLEEIIASGDKDLAVYAGSEKNELMLKADRLLLDIKEFIAPGDKNDVKNVIMEIRAGTGGEEAALFAGDLYRMYLRYAENRGWKTEVLSVNQTGLKGFKEVIFSIEGVKVYKHLKWESGVHRVQRVPLTEASGRIHTSAVSVVVLPEADEVEVDIKNDDLRIDTFCSSGKGGQSVNTTYSAIRITHLPSGIVVQCQDERSQQRNKQKAMTVLRTKLMDNAVEQQKDSIDKDRKKHVGTGDRSEKIRTYNFPQDRVTDHRINYSAHNLKGILDGGIDDLISNLSLKMNADEN